MRLFEQSKDATNPIVIKVDMETTWNTFGYINTWV